MKLALFFQYEQCLLAATELYDTTFSGLLPKTCLAEIHWQLAFVSIMLQDLPIMPFSIS